MLNMIFATLMASIVVLFAISPLLEGGFLQEDAITLKEILGGAFFLVLALFLILIPA